MNLTYGYYLFSMSITMLASTSTQKGQVTIPLEIRKQWNLRPGDRVVFIQESGKVELRPESDFYALKGTIKSKKKYSDRAADAAMGMYVAEEHEKEER